MKKLTSIFASLVIFFSISALANEAAPKASLSCIGCHGPQGISMNPLWPNLARQKPDYLMKQLHDFRDGKRVDPIMNGIAKSLSDADIHAVATYYSSL